MLLLLASNFVDNTKSNIIKTSAINLFDFTLVKSKAKIHTLHSMLVYSVFAELTTPCASCKDFPSQNLYLDHTWIVP